MADEDKTIIDGGNPEGNDAPQKASKSGNKLILFGGIGLGAIVIGIVLALFVIKPMLSDAPAEDESGNTEQVAQKKEVKKAKHYENGEKAESIIYAIKNIVINPAGTGGSRFLSVSFGFQLESKQLEEEFTQKEPIIRDALITIMSSKTVAELTDSRQKEICRYQIKKRVSELMHTDELDGVYYTDFVLQ